MPKVVLDPGHGQFGNPGVANGYYEGTQMWHLGQYLQIEFIALGWDVTNTRPKLTDNPALELRGQMAKGHDLFMSLHSNAPGTSAVNYANIRGVAIYDSVADELDYIEVPLVAKISEVMNTPNLGVKHRWNTRADRHDQDYYGVLRNAVTVVGCPDAMLIEHGYHTNLLDATWLMSHDNLKKLAKAEATLINSLWRQKHEGDNMIICKRGDKDAVLGNKNVASMQTGLVRLDPVRYDMGSWGVDGSYGPTVAGNVGKFRADTGITGSSDVWDTYLNNELIVRLSKLEGGGISQEKYDKVVAELGTANAQISTLNTQLAEELLKVATLTFQLDTETSKNNDLTAQVTTLNGQLVASQEEVVRLQKELDLAMVAVKPLEDKIKKIALNIREVIDFANQVQ